MIIYQATKRGFFEDVISNRIEDAIEQAFRATLGHGVAKNEAISWRNSMLYMNNVLSDSDIPDDAGVVIEYRIPLSNKRVDFILTGQADSKSECAILIELKQWSKAALTEKDGLVETYLGRGQQEVSHPSYQVWSYASLMESFNEEIGKNKITLKPCAYLHNYQRDGLIDNEFYKEYIEKAPLFLKEDVFKLREFIKKFVKYGDKSGIMYRIEHGNIRPSKTLADSLSSMLSGNQEFFMIDEQKVVYENAINLTKQAQKDKNKKVLIVEGGPGTGKSVVAINLLVQLTKMGILTQYVTKNAAPRTVYQTKLKEGKFKNNEISSLFTSSGVFTNVSPNLFGALIVDEAHRLNEKSGIYKNIGENQVKEIINASRFSVFFIDEDQKVSIHDIGEKQEIRKWAENFDAEVFELKLSSQFRCSGSDGYLAWLDNLLQVKETANYSLSSLGHEFKVFESPDALRDAIFEKNAVNNKSRLVAGYCWKWLSKKDKNAFDIVLPNSDFKMKWNLVDDGMNWLIRPDSVNEVGCIHTCQGLELDYVGVIIGEDLIVRNNEVLVDPSKRDVIDTTIRGYKKLMKQEPESTKILIEAIIKNTYRTLMTRGMKGCYVYSVDQETNEYLKKL